MQTPEKKKEDLILLHSPTEDGKGVNVIRAKEGALSVGVVRPLEEGKSITNEVVRLKPKQKDSPVCEVETLYMPPQEEKKKMPTQVATKAYRENYERIFGSSSSEDPNKSLPSL